MIIFFSVCHAGVTQDRYSIDAAADEKDFWKQNAAEQIQRGNNEGEKQMNKMIVTTLAGCAGAAIVIGGMAGARSSVKAASTSVGTEAQTERSEASADSMDFPDLGIRFSPTGVWKEMQDHILTSEVYGSDADPVSGVMFDFANDEALEKAKTLIDQKADGQDIETARIDNSKRLFAVAWVRTGETPIDTVMELTGGPDRLSSVEEMGTSGNATFYFCTYPSIDGEGLSDTSRKKFEALKADLDEAKKDVEMSEPPAPKEAESGEALSFSTTDLSGNPADQSIFKDNKVTLVNIWGSFCEPCMEELPDLEKLSADMKSQGVGVVGILGDAIDSKGEMDQEIIQLGRQVAEKKGVTYPNLAMTSELSEEIPTQTYPTSVLVNAEGVIIGDPIYGTKSYDEYKELIQEALKSEGRQ
jgi:thiol-disulfide isomerase/thioredoxin